MLKVAVCDDDDIELKDTIKYLMSYSMQHSLEISIDKYSSGEEFLANYEIGKYSLVMLDVELKEELDGIDIARTIRQLPDKDVQIVYVSSYPAYMQKSFGVHAANYLVKPISFESVDAMLSQLLDDQSEDAIIPITYAHNIHYICKNHIAYVEPSKGRRNCIDIITVSQRLSLRKSAKQFIDEYQLPLCCIGYSIYVSLNHIQEIRLTSVIMDNQTELPMLKRFRQPLISQMTSHIRSKMTGWMSTID